MNPEFDTDVAVIGYGPSGLAASLKLAHHGVRVMAFEKERSIYPRARAVTVNDWTMRCFQSIGLDEAVARAELAPGRLASFRRIVGALVEQSG